MQRLKPEDFTPEFNDEDSCLEWLKDRLYPDGIHCPVCNKVTKHHKLSKRPCYCCDSCGHQVYPTAGTIFYRSSTPLKTWFEIIAQLATSKSLVSAKNIQREYSLTYRTACRLVQKIEKYIREDRLEPPNKDQIDHTVTKATHLIIDSGNPVPGRVKNTDTRSPGSSTILKRWISPSLPLSSPRVSVGEELEGEGYLHFQIGRSTSPSTFEFGHSQKRSENVRPRQHYNKRDRTARLLMLQMLLSQNSQGLKVNEIAERCSISQRTVYRDLKALESEMKIPIWQNGNNRGIIDGYFLPPINFTLAEAATLFLAARLTQNYFNAFDSNIASLFLKLNTITPAPLKNEIQQILEHLEKQPRDSRRVRNFNVLLNAWLSRHKVRVITRASLQEEPEERIIEPYIIEPSAIGHGSYVIAFCNLKKRVYAFNLEHIIGDVIMLPEIYEIPVDFKAIDFLNSAWGIQIDQEIQTVKLHFNSRIGRTILEEINQIHPSQTNELQPDGSLIVSFKIRDYINIRNWIMKWGNEVEVIEPETLRNQIHSTAQSIADIYSKLK